VTDCAIIRDELLDAAPDELAGVAPTALATHVRACPRCGPLARMLLDEQSRLGSALALIEPRMSAAAAAALAAYIVYGNRPPVYLWSVDREVPATAVRITAMPGTGTIVLQTADPDITFAWIGKEIAP